ncbi:expressed protein [Chlorella variabilis]|uniref:1-alkyl-2-acetylglycerophosphocholine esterase n=1 Tax=Chlorella variabilis TaxID=554065 RepID=E1ZBJ4_CHLVA|nr:expressed protein [Chlorella variabilis]EFN56866.1 expressed protein [Chlorella variabilis]|eukprot:XP_005848968.1 expressed protein [Chlorella variabilis]
MWKPFGRFHVGYCEAEWSCEEGQPVAGRLYYPAERPSGGAASWLPWRWRGVPWLWHRNYARGLGKFLFFRLNGWMYDVLEQAGGSSRGGQARGLIAFAWAAGKSQRLDLSPGAPLAPDAPSQLPLIIFSHGLGGNRFLYTIICSELASQGYVVLAVEHADGTACVARLPGGAWKFYAGLGDEAAQVAKTRVRVAEMRGALQMMRALHRGDRLAGLELAYGLDASAFLRGRLDMRCVAAAGHSYGGATITALVAEDPLYQCGVALDPWWYAVFPESKALTRFATRTPLLVMGSHDWNVPNAFGQGPPPAAAPVPPQQPPPQHVPNGDAHGGDGGEEPDDVVTGAEAAEAALPSGAPASGARPHAPGAAAAAPPLTGATQPSAGLARPLTAARRAALRAGVNQRYSPAVEVCEVEEVHALLGSEHIFIAKTW